MKKSRYTEEQIVRILRETDRDPVATVPKRHGVSEQAIYTWKKRFGSFQPDDVRRLKQLEQENARLRKAESALTSVRVFALSYLVERLAEMAHDVELVEQDARSS